MLSERLFWTAGAEFDACGAPAVARLDADRFVRDLKEIIWRVYGVLEQAERKGAARTIKTRFGSIEGGVASRGTEGPAVVVSRGEASFGGAQVAAWSKLRDEFDAQFSQRDPPL